MEMPLCCVIVQEIAQWSEGVVGVLGLAVLNILAAII